MTTFLRRFVKGERKNAADVGICAIHTPDFFSNRGSMSEIGTIKHQMNGPRLIELPDYMGTLRAHDHGKSRK